MSSMCPADTEVRKGSRSALSGQLTASAVFSRDGRCIYLGQTRGLLSVLDANNLQFLDVVKVRGPAACCTSCQHWGLHFPETPALVMSRLVALHLEVMWHCSAQPGALSWSPCVSGPEGYPACQTLAAVAKFFFKESTNHFSLCACSSAALPLRLAASSRPPR